MWNKTRSFLNFVLSIRTLQNGATTNVHLSLPEHMYLALLTSRISMI